MARLGEVCNINMGQSPPSSSYNKKNDGLPFFQGNTDFGEIHPTVRVWCNMPVKIANKNDILISVRASIGDLNIADCKCCIGRGLASLTVDESICSQKYLWHVMHSMANRLKSKGTGSTFKAITKNTLEDLEIPLPPLDEQRKIAALLDNVSHLIALSKQQAKMLDVLVRARFAEMFGTFPANEKNWDICTIRDVVSDVRYGTSRPSVNGGAYPYLRMNNITYSGELDLTEVKRIDVPDAELPKCSVRYGDVLFNRTNSRELVGKTCVYDRDEMMVLAGFIIRIRVNDKVVPRFLSAFLNTDFSKHMLRAKCKPSIGQANINAQEMQDIGIYLPPLNLQQDFATFAEKAQGVKTEVMRSTEQLETLKKALMQKYFWIKSATD